MTFLRYSLLALLVLGAPPAKAQKSPAGEVQTPIEITLCRIVENPPAYNNKLVKVRSVVRVSFEYSTVEDEGCSHAIWFAFADGSMPPGLGGILIGKGIPGTTDSKGVRRAPLQIHLLKDANYDQLIHYLQASAKGDSCLEGPQPASEPPDCRTYRVTATFTGRIDSVSKDVHAAHAKRSSGDQVDGKGFGHMGMFDAQLVVQSVEEVTAVDTSAPKAGQPTHH